MGRQLVLRNEKPAARVAFKKARELAPDHQHARAELEAAG
jgi:hypothetical protein